MRDNVRYGTVQQLRDLQSKIKRYAPVKRNYCSAKGESKRGKKVAHQKARKESEIESWRYLPPPQKGDKKEEENSSE